MSTLHKVKAYFGMAPMEDYDDEYYDDRAPSRGYARPRFDDDYGRYDGRDYDDARSDSRGDLRGEPADYPPPGYRGGYADEPRFRPREFDRAEMTRPRFDRGCATLPAAR